jgi:hypothetical protein
LRCEGKQSRYCGGADRIIPCQIADGRERLGRGVPAKGGYKIVYKIGTMRRSVTPRCYPSGQKALAIDAALDTTTIAVRPARLTHG